MSSSFWFIKQWYNINIARRADRFATLTKRKRVMGFKDELGIFNKIVLSRQNESANETIDEMDVVKALIILNFLKYNKVPDAFLGCSAMNLLNTYAKQDNAKINYEFRKHLVTILKGIEDINQPKTIRIFFEQKDGNNVLMIIFWDFQFSFQNEKNSEIIRRLQTSKDIPWDGVRKQKCAKTIFDFALNNSWISDMTGMGNSLRNMLRTEMVSYEMGEYSFINGMVIKTKGIIPGVEHKEKYFKNYFRDLLKQYQDRPVLLHGKFKRIWDKHITFTTIRPYIQGVHTLTICDHINLYRPDVEKVYDITKFEKNRKYYIFGYCTPYRDGNRMGVKVALDFPFRPIYSADEFREIPDDIFGYCQQFSIEYFLRANQTHLKL